jgi:hypothetical protein
MEVTLPPPDGRDFFFDGQAVGILFDSGPLAPGERRYMPYRGAGHYEMAKRLRSGQPADCYVEKNGLRQPFIVTKLPAYGVIEISEVGDFQAPAENP